VVFSITKGEGKGQWRIEKGAENPAWVKATGYMLTVKCPGCGVDSIMSSSVHKVAADGTVHPSYVCPYPPCTFHEWVRLEGWGPKT
jgi:hypothetical protein